MVHVGLLKDPPAPPSLQLTDPVGVLAGVVVSDTVAVKRIEAPALSEGFDGVITVVVPSSDEED